MEEITAFKGYTYLCYVMMLDIVISEGQKGKVV